MEDELDEIAQGKKGKVDYLSDYYLGEEGLRARVSQKQETIDWAEAKRARVPGLEVSKSLFSRMLRFGHL